MPEQLAYATHPAPSVTMNAPMQEQSQVANAVENALKELKASNKRKRDTSDQGGDGKKRGPSMNSGHDDWSNSTSDFSTLSHQLARHVNSNNGQANGANASSTAAAALAGLMPSLTVPQPTELSFTSTGSGPDGDSSFEMSGQENGQNHHSQGTPYNLGSFQGTGTAAQVEAARAQASALANAGGPGKPAVGSDEWHKVRRDNHKEGECDSAFRTLASLTLSIVERRRRETINEGINELAKIVPGCEKNKGSILQRAVQYITQLRENEGRNIEKWTLEKMLTDQALSEVTSSLDKLKDDLHLARSSAERYRKICHDNGIDLKDGDDENAGGTDDDGDS